jgi:hypothetical protein
MGLDQDLYIMSLDKLEEFKQICANHTDDSNARFDDFINKNSERCGQWRKAYQLDSEITHGSGFRGLYCSVGYNVLYGNDLSHARHTLDFWQCEHIDSKPPKGFVYIYVNCY